MATAFPTELAAIRWFSAAARAAAPCNPLTASENAILAPGRRENGSSSASVSISPAATRTASCSGPSFTNCKLTPARMAAAVTPTSICRNTSIMGTSFPAAGR